MKQKLFENVGGNQFKLITESVIENNPKSKLVREGLKKVFSAGNKSLSYKKLEGVGMGYIKSVEEARKCAIQEARELAREYGYVENETAQKFVKEEGHPEADMSDPKEEREVQIGKEILNATAYLSTHVHNQHAPLETMIEKITALAKELIELHMKKATTKPGTGETSHKAGSGNFDLGLFEKSNY